MWGRMSQQRNEQVQRSCGQNVPGSGGTARKQRDQCGKNRAGEGEERERWSQGGNKYRIEDLVSRGVDFTFTERSPGRILNRRVMWIDSHLNGIPLAVLWE